MKKTLLISVVFLFVNLSFAQLKSGRYYIKLSENNKTVYSYQNNTVTLHETSDVSLNNEDFLWDVKIVRGETNLFTIQKVNTLKCLTFKINPSTSIISKDTYMEPKLPLAKNAPQTFQILSVGNENYTIQPGKIKDNEAYFAARLNTINQNGGDLQFEYKNQTSNPSTFRNTSNIYFKFINAPVGSSSVIVTNVNQPIRSPSVYVSPKSENKIDLDFKTGGDNLDPKDFMEGLKITIKISNKPDIVKENANESKEWPNNSIRRVTINIPADVACADINEVIISRDTKSRSANNMTAVVGDNWNLDKVTITSRFKINGAIKSNSMNYLSPSGSSFPLYRFTYEDRDRDSNTGKILSLKVNGICSTENTTTTSTQTNSNAKLTCIFGTGGDNLEGGNGNNVNIRIRFKSSTKVLLLNNVNDTAKWNNFTENTVTKEISNSNDIDINDIKEVEVRHTGGGGMFADNWHVDKIKITINKGNQNKVLVDKVGAPIHMFTGDTRSKRFNVE